jgi:hypothetical protein
MNTTRSPSPRADAQIAYDAADGYVVLFGGTNASSLDPTCQVGCAHAFNDTWIFTGTAWRQFPIPGPAPRVGAGFIYDAADGYLLLFGGQLWNGSAPGNVTSQTWSYAHGAWSYLGAAGPAPRFDAPLAYDALDGYVVLYGGVLGNGTVANDTWSYFGGVWTPVDTHGPPPDAYQESMTYDAADGYVMLVGSALVGSAGLTANESWGYSGGHWTLLATQTNPPFLWGAWVAYDPAVGYVVLLGEQVNPADGALFNVTWGYLGGSWFQVPTVNPSLRLGLSPLTYDPLDASLFAFGGEQWPNGTLPSELRNDTWTFTAPPIAFQMSVSASPQGVCPGNASLCPAGLNTTRVTLRLSPVYVDPNVALEEDLTTVPMVGSPTILFVPWGSLAVPTALANLTPSVTCADPLEFTGTCDPNTTLVHLPGGVVGLSWRWSTNPFRDQMLVRARWSASFNLTVTGPPIGEVPLDACITDACRGAGSGPVDHLYTSISYAPFLNLTRGVQSFPLGTLSVEPPEAAPPTVPVVTPPPPPPAPAPIPPPITPAVPPAPAPSAGASGSSGAGIGLLPAAAGVVAAGFTQITLPRKLSMAVAAPAGAGFVREPNQGKFGQDTPRPQVGRSKDKGKGKAPSPSGRRW